MVNPDGVARGHYRLDYWGFDLNRCYNRAIYNKKALPAIYSII